MKKEIIKINTNPELTVVKIGDIVQFDNLEPVKVVKLTDCTGCAFDDICNYDFRYCDYVNNTGVMFKVIKIKEK